MIVLPYNDYDCLGAITEIVAGMVAARDPILVEMAAQYPTAAALVDYIRSLPQRDDLGAEDDGPRVHACAPPQRLRFGVDDPNCVERAAVFIGVEEFHDPYPDRRLATVDTPIGMHTFPVVGGRPIVLDPRVTSDCLECGLAINTPGPIAVEPRNAISWTADMAAANAVQLRNGPSTLYLARNAIRRLIDGGTVPASGEIDAMGILFALAEKTAQRYGTRALAIVRTATRAVSDLLDAVLERRNAAINIGGLKFNTPQWVDSSAPALAKVGLDLGSLYLRTKLGALGIGADVIGLVESRLGEENRTLGAFAHPPELATFSKFAAPRTG